MTTRKICDRCGHDAGRHYSGDSSEPEERAGNYCAAHDCGCRGFIEATLTECGSYRGYPKTRCWSLSYQCVELRLYGYASERALDVAIDAAIVSAASAEALGVPENTAAAGHKQDNLAAAESSSVGSNLDKHVRATTPATEASRLHVYASLAAFVLISVVGILILVHLAVHP